MARAYPHMTDVTQRFAHYANQSVFELKSAIEDIENERDMFIELLRNRLKLTARFRRYCERRITVCDRQIKAAEADQEMFVEEMRFLRICTTCKGSGELREYLAQDSTRQIACTDCKGRGSE